MEKLKKRLTAVRLHEPEERERQSALATSGPSTNANLLSRQNCERHILEDRVHLGGVTRGETLDLDLAIARGPVGWGLDALGVHGLLGLENEVLADTLDYMR